MPESFRAIITLLGPTRPGTPGQPLPGPEEPVDPGYGVEEPVDPGYGIPGGRPPHVSHRPLPPGMFPPHKPIQPLPPGRPPATIWPPEGHIDNTLPLPPPDLLPPEAPDQGLPPTVGQLPVWPTPGEPGTIWPPLPNHDLPDGGNSNVLIIVWVPGVGYRWIVVDPSLKVDNTLPAPPMPQPK